MGPLKTRKTLGKAHRNQGLSLVRHRPGTTKCGRSRGTVGKNRAKFKRIRANVWRTRGRKRPRNGHHSSQMRLKSAKFGRARPNSTESGPNSAELGQISDQKWSNADRMWSTPGQVGRIQANFGRIGGESSRTSESGPELVKRGPNSIESGPSQVASEPNLPEIWSICLPHVWVDSEQGWLCASPTSHRHEPG